MDGTGLLHMATKATPPKTFRQMILEGKLTLDI